MLQFARAPTMHLGSRPQLRLMERLLWVPATVQPFDRLSMLLLRWHSPIYPTGVPLNRWQPKSLWDFFLVILDFWRGFNWFQRLLRKKYKPIGNSQFDWYHGTRPNLPLIVCWYLIPSYTLLICLWIYFVKFVMTD